MLQAFAVLQAAHTSAASSASAPMACITHPVHQPACTADAGNAEFEFSGALSSQADTDDVHIGTAGHAAPAAAAGRALPADAAGPAAPANVAGNALAANAAGHATPADATARIIVAPPSHAGPRGHRLFTSLPSHYHTPYSPQKQTPLHRWYAKDGPLFMKAHDEGAFKVKLEHNLESKKNLVIAYINAAMHIPEGKQLPRCPQHRLRIAQTVRVLGSGSFGQVSLVTYYDKPGVESIAVGALKRLNISEEHTKQPNKMRRLLLEPVMGQLMQSLHIVKCLHIDMQPVFSVPVDDIGARREDVRGFIAANEAFRLHEDNPPVLSYYELFLLLEHADEGVLPVCSHIVYSNIRLPPVECLNCTCCTFKL